MPLYRTAGTDSTKLNTQIFPKDAVWLIAMAINVIALRALQFEMLVPSVVKAFLPCVQKIATIYKFLSFQENLL